MSEVEEYKEWIDVEPIHCHKRIPENTMISKLRVHSTNRRKIELLMKLKPDELGFFFDHEIDHLPGMSEVCALRQCALAVAHLVYNVPMDYMIVLEWLDVSLFNFAELEQEIIAKLELVDERRSKNKIELILDGLLVQDEYITMRMKGKLYAFAPPLAKKMRRYKSNMDEVLTRIKNDKHAEGQIVEVHIKAAPRTFKETCVHLEKLLRSKSANNYNIVPLYFTYDEEDFEIRICFKFDNPKMIGDFTVERIRPIIGIENTRVRLTLDGKIFHKGVAALAIGDEKYYSIHIFLQISPKHDHDAWEALCSLKETKEVFPTWCMRDYYEYDRDVTLRIMGTSKEGISEYVKNNVESIVGVTITKAKYMQKLVKIQDNSKLLLLANRWLK